ncbi:polyphenol oxidase family protein [Oligoflexaceae bacterium]|nr:polyphenol oxidase family protein [Oligoflexaceae bacterium]
MTGSSSLNLLHSKQIIQVVEWLDKGIVHGFSSLESRKPGDLFSVKQVHGVNGVFPDDFSDLSANNQEGDWLTTRFKATSVAIQTADCLPILGHDPNSGRSWAIHAGWRGFLNGILSKSLHFLQAEGVDLSLTEWAIGPAISKEKFEVGPEVYKPFEAKFAWLKKAQWKKRASAGKGDRYHLDLPSLALDELQKMGVVNTVAASVCTFSNDEWHSYRRSGAKAGRNWSWVAGLND